MSAFGFTAAIGLNDKLSANSTTDSLDADGIFTGPAESILNYASIFINILSAVDSAANGLSIEQSSDGINWDHKDTYTIFANSGKNYSINPNSQYFRIVYTNGSTPIPEGGFRLQTIFKHKYATPSSHRLGDTIKDDDDAQLVKSVVSVETNEPGIYENVKAQNPLPTNGDSVYGKDLLLDLSDAGDFIITTEPSATKQRILTSMVSNVEIEKKNDTSTNPKNITLTFARPILTNTFGIDSGPNGTFSNVKITIFQGQASEVIIDESSDNTTHEIRLFDIAPVKFSKMLIQFYTVNTITTGLIGIFKSTEVAARLQAVSELNGTVEPINSFRGALNINQALVHKVGVNLFFFRETGTSTTMAATASVGDTSINVADSTGFNVGDKIKLTSSITSGQSFIVITAIVVNLITLDRPLSVALAIGDDVDVVSTSLNVNGSLGSPVIFKIIPPNGGLSVIWQLTRLLINITDATSMDDGKFGGIPALTNGVNLRIVKGDGSIQDITNWKTNGEIALDMFDVTYTDKAPAGTYGLRGRWTFTKAEFIVELNGAAGDYFELLVQDDLRGNTGFEIKSQGRLFGG